MRALQISMTAFGPYREKQIIDFREIGSESIFLITGPTGAGKTTIFDAICFALYGKASGSDREQDSLRSHFASPGETTEVRFLFSLRGTEYEIVRYPRQQKKKERGDGFTEDPARAEFYKYQDGRPELISAKIKEVNESLEALISLDYEQFRKMIMIPQGEFRRLIAENSKEREEILQRIFRTYFYEQITEELKEQARTLMTALEQTEWQLKQEIAKIEWQDAAPGDEHVSADTAIEMLEAELEKAETAVQQHTKQLETAKENWRKAQQHLYDGRQLEEQYHQLSQFNREQQQLKARLPEINEKQKRLELAKQASAVEPAEKLAAQRLQEWQRREEQKAEKQRQQQVYQDKLAALTAAYEKEKNREQDREALKEKLTKEREQLGLLERYQQAERELSRIIQQKASHDQQTETTKANQQRVSKEKEALEKALEKEAEVLQQIYQTKEQLEKAVQKQEELNRLTEETNKLNTLRAAFRDAKQKYERQQQQVMELRTQISDLEASQSKQHAAMLANQLSEGEPCPVCGSIHHPNLQLPAESLASFEQLKAKREALQQAEQTLLTVQNQYVQAKTDGQAQRQITDQLAGKLVEKDEIEEQHITAAQTVNTQQLQKIRSQLQMLEEKQQLLQEQKKQRKTLQEKLTQLQEKIEADNQRRDKLQQQLTQLETSVSHQRAMLPEELPDLRIWQQRLENEEAQLRSWLERWKTLQHQYEEAQDSYKQTAAAFHEIQAFAQDIRKQYELEQTQFETARSEHGFSSEALYQAAKLAAEEQIVLANELEAYNQRVHTVEEKVSELTAAIKDREHPDLEALQAAEKEAEKLFHQVTEQLNGYTSFYKQHQKILSVIKDYQKQMKEKEAAYYDIGELAALAKGDNSMRLSFERFVLSSFLDEIILQANIRLEEMTDHRYQLKRSGQIAKRGAQSGLDLEVIDHHTGQERPVKTLSGGEGFKAALALALGMSDVVQAHAGGVELETLFIDEGFGTLDELSLEQAIDSLKGLQQSNRVLGIISHVPQLKEEIHTKLQITATAAGSTAAFIFE